MRSLQPEAKIFVGWFSGAMLGLCLTKITYCLPFSNPIASLLNHQHPDFGQGTLPLLFSGLGGVVGMMSASGQIEDPLNNQTNESIIIQPTNPNQSIELPAYAKAFYEDSSISIECKELFKIIFIDIIKPNTIESIQPLEKLVGKDGKLTTKLKEFNDIHFKKDFANHLGCRESAHSSNKSDPWQTIKITAPNILEVDKTSVILLELKKNLDKHYHLKSGGGNNWKQWLNLSFEDKMKQNKCDPLCFDQKGTIMTPQLMLTLIDLKKILGLIKDNKEYITALEQAYSN